MNNKLSQNDETSDALSSGINESWKTYMAHIYTFLNDALDQSPLRRIERLQYILREVYPITHDEWVNGFLWILPPQQEILRMECVAYVYAKVSSKVTLSLDEKKELYSLINEMSCSGPSDDIEKYIETYIEQEIEEYIEAYK